MSIEFNKVPMLSYSKRLTNKQVPSKCAICERTVYVNPHGRMVHGHFNSDTNAIDGMKIVSPEKTEYEVVPICEECCGIAYASYAVMLNKQGSGEMPDFTEEFNKT